MRKFFAALPVLCLALSAAAIDTENTRLLTQPAISNTHIAFIYGEDLWICNRDGSYPRRLTVDEGIESNPVFSPDGRSIAFNAQYDGNTDVFVIPASGGIPRRLTWHPTPDLVREFTPDGKKVMFASQRSVFTTRFSELFTVDLASGFEEKLPVPNANWASYSTDGKMLAYTPLSDRFDQWKNYRGGTQTRIWLMNMSNMAVAEVPKPKNGANDSKPVYAGGKVFFRSDRDGEFNIYSYDPGSKAVTQHTRFSDFPVTWLAASDKELVFEQAGYLHTMPLSGGNSQQLKIGIGADLLDLRERYVSNEEYVRSIDLSPSGVRVIMDYRGDIITAPAQKGDYYNLTNTPGVHETSPSWSPDGRTVAYFSNESGEYAIHLQQHDGLGATRKLKLNGTGFYNNLGWSPDSKHLNYVDNGRNLYIMEVATGTSTKIASDDNYVPGPYRQLAGSWSGDGRFLAYTTVGVTSFERAYIYSLAERKSYPVSDGLSNVSEPVFDPSGKYLYMFASTDAGPVVNWFDQSNQDMMSRNTLWLVTLQRDVMSPLAKENEVEEIKDTTKPKTSPAKTPVSIDWEGMSNRIVGVPVPAGMYSNLVVPKEGEIYYIRSTSPDPRTSMVYTYNLKKRKEEGLMNATGFAISAKGDKMLFGSMGKYGIAAAGQKPGPDAMINLSSIQVKVDPVKEWENIFNEAWQVNRDYFYDPGMHGTDWKAMKTKYAQFLPHLSSRSDLYRVMTWMFSELSVGHHRMTNGDQRYTAKSVPGGLLGADYEVANGRYRIKKIYGGLNWTPGLASPLTEPGVDVKEGDYIIEVNGQPVNSNKNLYSFFENTAGKIVRLTVSANPDGSNARTAKLTAIASESALRNRDWVEGNIRKVHAATNGQVAYVYVPNTATGGHEYFKRYFFPQADKKGIIVDERFNGGGQLADYVIDILKRPAQSYWKFRYGQDLKAPNASIQGPKVMLIDETAGSGGDYLPYLFRQAKLGTLVGKRTWGGLVGVLGYPEFIDGGSVTAPNLAFYNEEMGYGIENVGTPPDVEVEQWPADVMKGRDPQLEKAIEIVMQQLKANPPKEVKSPDFPVRVRK